MASKLSVNETKIWRRAKRRRFQVFKEDGKWYWSENYGEYSEPLRTRQGAIREAIEHFVAKKY
jgi:hypothetical protein